MRAKWRNRVAGEQGQVIPLLALAMVALIAMVGLAIDVGRVYAKRTELTRSLDSGALAGVLELPDMDKARLVAQNYVAFNQPDATNILAEQVGASQQLRVTASVTVPMTFLRVIGVPPITVTQSAVAGMGTIPMDVVLAIDTTGSMGYSPCNSSYSNDGCRIKEAKDAANLLVDTLLGVGGSNTYIGMVPFNWCWKPPDMPSGTPYRTECKNLSTIMPLTNNASALHSAINALTPSGKTGTCEGLRKAGDTLFGTGSHPSPPAFKAIVLLSDGANTYANSYIPAECRPTTLLSGCCNECPGNAMTGSMDRKTYEKAQALKAQGVEIFVVALAPCDTQNTNPCNPAMIGSWTGNYASNLLKCVASSLPGTNDHYFETDDPTELSQIFLNIARLLALRLLE